MQLCIWLLSGANLFRYFSPAASAGIKTGVSVLLGTSPPATQFLYEKVYLALLASDESVNGYAAETCVGTVVSGLTAWRP